MSQSATVIYDGVIIGGGLNGLITAAYLAKAGLNVAVLERRGSAGGGMCTEEATLPGFRHNLHAIHCKFHYTPIHYDLELERFGASLIYPEVKVSVPFSDGKALICHVDIKKTCESLSNFSEKDGRKFAKLAEKWNMWYQDLILPEIFNPPLASAEREEVIKKRPGGEEYLQAASMSIPEYAEEIFEEDRNRALFMWAAGAASYTGDIKGMVPLVFLTFISWLTRKIGLVKGGTQQYAQALVQVISREGGLVLSSSHVEKILISNCEATGVILADGTIVNARRFIVSAIDPVQTLLKLVGEEHLEEEVVKKIREYRWEDWALFAGHLALREPPKHRAAKFDSRVDSSMKYVIGLESPEDFARHGAEVKRGELSENPSLGAGCLTLFDPSLAPPGMHVAYFWVPSPYDIKKGGPSKWDEIKMDYLERCLERWGRYAANLDERNIICKTTYTPYDISRKVISMVKGGFNLGKISPDQNGAKRPIEGMGNYRTPIKRLYISGAGTHPGGTMLGAPGYNVANVIAEDLGIPKWWKLYQRLA